MLRHVGFLTALCCASALLFVARADAAGSVYWSNTSGTGLARADLSGGEGSDLNPSPVAAEEPSGSAVDALTGKVYWADYASNTIKYANLDGSGSAVLPIGAAEVDGPNGLVVDAADGRVYWANALDDTISWANLGGGGGGDIDTGAAPIEEPFGVAVDPSSNRIYWANFAGDSIGYANLDGSGEGGQVQPAADLAEEPDAVAVDPANNRIYWTNFEGGTGGGSIGWASLSLPSAGLLPLAAGLVVEPGGIAIDPVDRSRIYWTNEGSSEGVFAAWEDGEEPARIDTSGATLAHPSSPWLFLPPSLQGHAFRSQTVRDVALGAELTCDPGDWAGDGIESHLYRAPQSLSFGWTFEGVWVNGVTGETITAAQPGAYACHVTATNGAGSTTVTTVAYDVPHPRGPGTVLPMIKKLAVARDIRNGTATILVTVSGPGALSLSGKKLVADTVSASAAGIVKLKVVAKGKALRVLGRTGKLEVKAGIEFVTGPGRSWTSRSITLRRRVKGRPRHPASASTHRARPGRSS